MLEARKGSGLADRKTSTARVFVDSGNIIVNQRPLDEFFGRQTARLVMRQPLVVTDMADKVDV